MFFRCDRFSYGGSAVEVSNVVQLEMCYYSPATKQPKTSVSTKIKKIIYWTRLFLVRLRLYELKFTSITGKLSFSLDITRTFCCTRYSVHKTHSSKHSILNGFIQFELCKGM